jgi:hypothetical protein
MLLDKPYFEEQITSYVKINISTKLFFICYNFEISKLVSFIVTFLLAYIIINLNRQEKMKIP